MSRSQRAILLWSLLATPACGLVVGFESRELCDDCASSTADANANGETNSNAGGASSAGGTAAGGGSETTAVDGGGTASAADGSGGANTDSGGNTGGSGANTGGSTGSNTVDSGGSTSDSGGSTGGTDTDSGGTGGEMVTSSTGGTNTGGSTGTGGGGDGGTGAGGDGGTAAGGSGGTTATTTAGGSTTVGGAGGSGGITGNPSLCGIDDSFDATDSVGTYPAALTVGRNNSSRPWDSSWVEDDDVYVSARFSETNVVLAPTLLDDTGAHSDSVIATHGPYAFVAYGEFAAGDARIVMSQLNPLDPDTAGQHYTGPLNGDSAPRVVGVALRGSTSEALVAAIDADGAGVLSLFHDGQHIATQTVPGPIEDLTPLDLGTSFAIAYVEGGSLQIAVVPYAFTGIDPPIEIDDASPVTPGLGSLAAATIDEGAALVWLQEYGVYLTTVDDEGLANESPVQISPGTSLLPKVVAWGNQLFVSWIDAASDALYLQRFPDGLTNTESPLLVADGVTDIGYGFATDPFLEEPTLGLVYSTNRLRMTIVNCPE